jgi:demethylmenaquinone methyltransferase/2-methoxy-6-polyprenyl-1,4-benzoquinol methylase
MTDPLSESFGTTTVSPQERRALIRRVFVEVAPRYDLMNDLMSFGIHRLWKRRFAALAAAKPGETVVDLAGGTGDVARLMAQSGAAVLVVDPSTAMMLAGRRPDDRVLFVGGEGEHLPFADGSIDCLTVSFGIRNVTHLGRALTEICRVLKPGGRFLCLEFSRAHPVIHPFYQAWSSTVIPVLGAGVAGSPSAYRYLIESIRRFPDQQAFAGLIGEAGFEGVRWIDLSFGIAAIHIATKPGG